MNSPSCGLWYRRSETLEAILDSAQPEPHLPQEQSTGGQQVPVKSAEAKLADFSRIRLTHLSNSANDGALEESSSSGLEDGTPLGVVPTLFEWTDGGEKIYVTGTFANWNRKYRLHKNGPSERKDVFSALVHIRPGTHHIKFIVDDDLVISKDMPVAVDFTSVLVNYLEVKADDVVYPIRMPQH